MAPVPELTSVMPNNLSILAETIPALTRTVRPQKRFGRPSLGILERRPDVRKAEEIVVAANAEVSRVTISLQHGSAGVERTIHRQVWLEAER